MNKTIRLILKNGQKAQVNLNKPIVSSRETVYKAMIYDCGELPILLTVQEKYINGEAKITLKQYLESKIK